MKIESKKEYNFFPVRYHVKCTKITSKQTQTNAGFKEPAGKVVNNSKTMSILSVL